MLEAALSDAASRTGPVGEGERCRFRWLKRSGRELLLVEHAYPQAVICRRGAQLLHFQPRGLRPWLWCGSTWSRVGNVRGGIGVCWPWFGEHPVAPLWPRNGWSWLADWELASVEEHEVGVVLHWQLMLHDWQADLYMELDTGVKLRLVSRHGDTQPCRLSQAFRAHVRLDNLLAVHLRDLASEQRQPLSHLALAQQGMTVDQGLAVEDSGWRRVLQARGSQGLQVVQPFAHQPNDLAWAEALKFLCVEAVQAETGLEPEASATLCFSLCLGEWPALTKIHSRPGAFSMESRASP